MPPIDKQSEISEGSSTNQQYLNGRGDRRTTTQMNEGRVSGELEGSTLASSSRDGDRIGSRFHQRSTQNSSGFLVDNSFLPRSSKSLRAGQQRPRRSEVDRKEKRTAPEPEITVPKKKPSFPWSRSKQMPSSAANAVEDAAEESSSRPSDVRQRESSEIHAGERQSSDIGLDKDSIQIVNLALNLSESRKQNSLGRSGSSRVSGKWPAGPPPVPYGDSHSATVGAGQRVSQAPRSFTHAFGGHSMSQPATDEPTVLSLLPNTVKDDVTSYEFSDSTLARAEKTRRHFELWSEYLRLLPSLPPLRNASDTGADPRSVQSSDSHRVYNPLQFIRNRKIRFKEKCPINAEAEGWDDVDKVHDWVTNVERQHGHHRHSYLECLDLPDFHATESQTSQREEHDADMMPGSPPSSLKRASLTGSVKPRKPKYYWLISPADLLADAAWIEAGQNKSKIVDKRENKLYPELESSNVSVTGRHSTQRESMDTEHPTSRASMSDSQRGRAREPKRIGRGRHRDQYGSPSNAVRSSSVSTRDTEARRHKPRVQSDSSSNVSFVDDRHSLDSQSYYNSRMESPRFTRQPRLSSPQRASALPEEDVDDAESQPAQSSRPSSYIARRNSDWAHYEEHKASESSLATDEVYGPRMSLDPMDSTAPSSPAHPGYFPSIAVNLSPPSSRSPSPSKRALPRRIIHRHERSKSKHEGKGRDRVDESVDIEALRKQSAGQSDSQNRVGKLEPSPLPDRVSGQEDPANAEARKPSSQQAKLRGIFKGPGKIAGKVGNEVSKMGDFIMKKDQVHTRQSSLATSTSSDDSSEDVEKGKKSGPKALLRHFSTFSDDGKVSRKEAEKLAGKGQTPSLPNFASRSRQDERDVERKAPEGGAEDDAKVQKKGSDTSTPQKLDINVSHDKIKNHSFGGGLRIRGHLHKGQIRDPSVPFSMTRPPVTGLAQAKASPVPQKRPTLTAPSRSWSISSRSITTLADSGIPDKREVERTRALLLSSGIKAREITRRAETFRSPPPEFLQTSLRSSSNSTIPRVTRLQEFDVAAQCLSQRFEKSQYRLHQSMDRFPTGTFSPLKSQLSALETLVTQSLTPRVQAAAADAEQLSVHLNTNSTLEVKQISDALDKGLRKRRRRLRWLRRTGFVMLEWALVGILWWVWLIVMAFKIFRGIFRGALSGIRWVFWL